MVDESRSYPSGSRSGSKVSVGGVGVGVGGGRSDSGFFSQLHDGTLLKKSANTLGLWKSRWFVLRAEELVYYDSEMKSEQRSNVRRIELKEVRAIRRHPESKSGCKFDIQTQQRGYRLKGADPADCIEWLTAIIPAAVLAGANLIDNGWILLDTSKYDSPSAAALSSPNTANTSLHTSTADRYHGPHNLNGVPDGKEGEVTSVDGRSVYRGGMRDGRRFGSGHQKDTGLTLQYGTSLIAMYVGPTLDGMPHGVGRRVMTDGTIYEGGFSRGQPAGSGHILRDTHIAATLAPPTHARHSPSAATSSSYPAPTSTTLPSFYVGPTLDGVAHGSGGCETILPVAGVAGIGVGGSVYTGEFVHGQRAGQGIYTFKDGSRYEGEWLEGRRHGMGTHTTKGGRCLYVGEWKSNLPHGRGKQFYPDGAEFDGRFEDGERFEGRYTWPASSATINQSFTGRFVSHPMGAGGAHTEPVMISRPHGSGRLTCKDGRVFDGEWRDGTLTLPDPASNSNATLYSSSTGLPSFESSIFDRVLAWCDDSTPVWSITFLRDPLSRTPILHDHTSIPLERVESHARIIVGEVNRYGRLTWEDGRTYQGGLEKGFRNGAGTLLNAQGQIEYKGDYRLGKRHGVGTLYHRSGRKLLEGEWQNDWFHGAGVRTLADGREERGKWARGWRQIDKRTAERQDGAIYHGQLDSAGLHLPDGYGVMTLQTGEVTEGTFDHGLWPGAHSNSAPVDLTDCMTRAVGLTCLHSSSSSSSSSSFDVVDCDVPVSGVPPSPKASAAVNSTGVTVVDASGWDAECRPPPSETVSTSPANSTRTNTPTSD